MTDSSRPRPTRARRRLRALSRGAGNALEMLGRGRLGAPYRADHEVAAERGILRLRRYARSAGEPLDADPVLLVPPLMVTAEIYDISPELSSVTYLSSRGVDVWGVDFGAPEDAEGGWDRTLDEHVVAVSDAIDEIVTRTGRPVHLVGYSQGGMFAYQAAAYRRSDGVASVITFGSPVDMRRNLPVRLHDTLAERVLSVARDAIGGTMADMRGLPGTLTSRGFKLLSPRAEVKHLVGMLGLLHDREALQRMEPRRRFLNGEGFIAWPGPAFRSFVEQFVVDNRMRKGGFVIAGRTATLADIEAPVLYFVGSKDDMARPDAVRAIAKAAPAAETFEVSIPAGHFGLVVGSRAMTLSWPTVAEWVAWRAGVGDRPTLLTEDPEEQLDEAELEAELQGDDESTGVVRRMYDLATDVVDGLWHRMGDVSLELTDVVGAMRWQLPRVARLLGLDDSSRISMARLLTEQTRAIGDETFFLWDGRAYTYRQADQRVNAVARVLLEQGVKPGDHIGILMDNHPDFLTVVAALNRVRAVAVLLNAQTTGQSLVQAIDAGAVTRVVADLARADRALEAGVETVWVLGDRHGDGAPDDGAAWIGLDALVSTADDSPLPRPAGDGGRGGELAMLLFTSGTTGHPKAARITNRRLVSAALWGAVACELTPRQTVYCCLPLHHATGILAAVGSALVGGARLALAPRFSVATFWGDVRRYGADVVFYVGELCRYLVTAPPDDDESSHPVRLFVGNGMRPDVWRRLVDRFGPVRVIEFYGSTEGNVVLANVTGDKVGSVGRPFTGGGELAVVRWDHAERTIVCNADGFAQRAGVDEPGLLVARVDRRHPLARFDGYLDPEASERKLRRDLFEPGDVWFDTGDLLRHDADGDYWFVDRLGDTFRWKGENVATAQVEDVLSQAPFVALAAVYGVELPDREGRAGMAAVELVEGHDFDGELLYRLVAAQLTPPARPRFVRIVPRLETTDTLKVRKQQLLADGADPGRVADPLYWYDAARQTYAPLDMSSFVGLILRS